MSKTAAGFLEVLGYSVAMDAMDKACKGSDIKIEGIDCNNPRLGDSASIPNVFQVKFTGEVEQVKNALKIARETAGKYLPDDDILTHCITGGEKGIQSLLSLGKVKARGEGRVIPPPALGIVDVKFYAAAVAFLDAMLKAADIRLLHRETVLGGKLVTLFVGGTVSQAEGAINAVREIAKKQFSESLKNAIVITKPHIEIMKFVMEDR